MSPIDWATRPLKNYAGFTGRAPRAELWWYVLLIIVLMIVAKIVEDIIGLAPIAGFYGPLVLLVLVGTFVPTLAVQVRRLHDTARSGYWLLAFYIPYFIYLYLLMGTMRDVGAMQAGEGVQTDVGALATTGLAGLVVLVLGIVLLVFYVLAGTKGPNKYGEDPYPAS